TANVRCDGTQILLCEDGRDNQRLIVHLLEKASAAVTVCDDGQAGVVAALDAWRRGDPFDLILMDMSMPVMDGYAATQKLRGAGYGGSIVALTAHAMSTDRKKCIEAGCDDYMTKPLDRQIFLTTASAWSSAGAKAAVAQVSRRLAGGCEAPPSPAATSTPGDAASEPRPSANEQHADADALAAAS
ncbi:MAG: response regulator, partial [Pirellulales bacterium]